MNWLIEKREPFTLYEYRITIYEYDLPENVIKENRYVEHQTKDSYTGKIHTITFEYDKDNPSGNASCPRGEELIKNLRKRGLNNLNKFDIMIL